MVAGGHSGPVTFPLDIGQPGMPVDEASGSPDQPELPKHCAYTAESPHWV